jgi:NADH-quinone oxidoreductase subunit F
MSKQINIEKLNEIRREISAARKKPKTYITICGGTGCHAYGCIKVAAAFKKEIKKQNQQDTVEVRTTGCHGFCERGPIVVIQPKGIFYQRIQLKDVKEIISETIIDQKIIDRLLYVDLKTGEKIVAEKDVPFYKKQKRIVFGNNGLIDPTEIKDYIAVNGYSALSKALESMAPQEVIEEIKSSGLRGRGGAGFRTGLKWEVTAKAKGNPKYIVCNCDEGDPGAYMDRSLLEGNPHCIIEGMLIGAYAIGARAGYVYVRAEYPIAVQNITIAIEQAKDHSLLGENILGTDFSFDLHIYKGAGAFVSGEETALLASIEGKIGVPTQRPPFPAQRGLWRKPTNINNVETWANVPIIIDKGAPWYSQIGTAGSKGTKIFSLVGKINNTGLVEVPMGMTLREIIFDIGGGIPEGKEFKAVQTGGPSGGCIPKELIDLPIDYESLAKAGSMMGSGGMIVMDEKTCMVDIAKYFLNFLRDESCGKCISCREGTQRMWEIVKNITDGKGTRKELALLEELAAIVKDASLCGLGQTASNPVLSTLRYFRHEYEAHIDRKKCPALVCQEIVSSPCQYQCPISQEASVYIALIAKGRYEDAYQFIAKDNPLPSICGRICHHPCEKVCRAGETGDPIAIRALKRFVTDYALEKGLRPYRDAAPQIKAKVAVIGAGPAGLTAAYYLALKGYQPTVFESLPIPGGWLAKGIPDHRLPKDVLNRDIEHIKSAGVNIKTNVALGKDFTLDDLFAQDFKAVFIATGAHKSMRLGVEGEEAAGVMQGTELLKAVNLGEKIKLGARVGIVGGGNAAVDAARVAVRDKNVKQVTILYRRTRQEMPAFKEEIEAAIEERVDIQYLAAPIKVLCENGRVKGVRCIRMRLGEIDSSGRRSPVPIEGSEFSLELETLIPAIGERVDSSLFTARDKLGISQWGTIEVDSSNLATGRPGVFAGGDAVTGPGTVVEAMAAGKLAAQTIEKYLEGQSLDREYTLTRPSIYIEPVELTEEELARSSRPKMPRLTRSARKKNFKEVELGLSELAAVAEARRCLRCELETEDGKNAIGRKT